MLRKSLLFLSEREGVKDLLLKIPTGRRVAGRFVAGETLPEALEASRGLNERGFRVTLDYLGENVSDRAEAREATRIYEESLTEIDRDAALSTISLKLTQIGLKIDEEFCTDNLRGIIARAGELGSFIRIDMEGSDHTAATLRIFRRVFAEHRNVGVVIQAYLRRSEDDVRELVELGAPVRLCKGAYDEPASVAFQDRKEVDRSYVRLMRILLDGVDGGHAEGDARGDATGGVPRVAIATHDEAMIGATRRHVSERELPSNAFEFQMLYGVRRDYQARLVEAGYGMRIYVPYGEQWYPYLMRRMAERPANLFFVMRALAGR